MKNYPSGKIQHSYEVGIAHFKIIERVGPGEFVQKSLFMADMQEGVADLIVRSWNEFQDRNGLFDPAH